MEITCTPSRIESRYAGKRRELLCACTCKDKHDGDRSLSQGWILQLLRGAINMMGVHVVVNRALQAYTVVASEVGSQP